MKRKLLSVLLALVLVFTLGLVTAVPAGAAGPIRDVDVTVVSSPPDHGAASPGYKTAEPTDSLVLPEGIWEITASGAMNFDGAFAPNVGLRVGEGEGAIMLAKSNVASEDDTKIISRGGFSVVGAVEGPITVDLVAYGGSVFEHNLVAIGNTPSGVTVVSSPPDHGVPSPGYKTAEPTDSLVLPEGIWEITASGAMNFDGAFAPNVGLRVGEGEGAIMLAKSNVASEDDTKIISRDGFSVVGAVEGPITVDLVAYGGSVFEHNLVAIGNTPSGVTVVSSPDHGVPSSGYTDAVPIGSLELGAGTWKITASGAMNFDFDHNPNVGLRAGGVMLAKSNLASSADTKIIGRDGFSVVGAVEGPITVDLVAYGYGDDGSVFEHNLVAIGGPGPAGTVDMTAIYPTPVIGISVSPASISFGDVEPGIASGPQMVTVTNTGNVAEDFDASLRNISEPDVYTTGLKIDTEPVSAWERLGVVKQTSVKPELILTVPGPTAPGTYRATLIFWAVAH